ncbi:MAG: DUF3488 domain-containing transglutaminase family protein [Gammaproteobacteria bacterium]|nr:DUF3488 and transglutaminase-like domain-containing protein [Gammaproteobacteria bacterium]NNC96756.1 DUF3488 domain-containing transglutaminase family protein [Gammaproteobacteria bacterium]NNM13514.1 DUF3488 domain-containing transglutaminase family protein [Gammaproteobacteria bacterium]
MTGAAYRLVPWTLAALIVSTLPHVLKLPIQITLLIAAIYIGRVYIHIRFLRMPKMWIKAVLIGVAVLAVLATFKTINGAQAGGALLLCVVALKTLEMHALRDHAVLLISAFFIIVSFVLDDNSIWSGIYLLLATSVCIFALLKLSAPELSWKQLMPNAKRFLLYGLPLSVLLFVLFPRIPGPLWGLPNTSEQAKTGLSDSMTPGMITDLVQSNELAFRVKFNGKEPARKDLYWRGPVLHHFDGSTWTMLKRFFFYDRTSEANSQHSSPDDFRYKVILEPHDQRWMYILDYPGELPLQSWMLPDFQVGRQSPISQLISYTASSRPGDGEKLKYHSSYASMALKLPAQGFEKTRELVSQWRQLYATDQEIVQAALSMFNQQEFSYTLQPQALDMSDSIDDFLFRTREGFCEHYASAFAVMMRSAGIPARVVTGYLGGDKNAFSGYYRITQADAHAWTEIYLQDRGWVRVDPTAAIAPERIQQNLQQTFPEENLAGAFSSFPLLLRLESAWYALNTAWFDWVLEFNKEKQQDLLKSLGFEDPDWSTLVWLMVSGILGFTVFMSWQMWRQTRRIVTDPLQKIYLKFIGKLEKQGLHKQTADGPLTYQNKALAMFPEQRSGILEFMQTYINARYYSRESKVTQSKILFKIFKRL